MNYKIDNLTVEELAVARQAVEDVRRKRRNEQERQAILDNLKNIWPDGNPVIYIARQNSDLTEGKGGLVDMGYFIDRDLAEKANSLLPGVFGTKNDARVREVRLFLTLAEWREAMGV